jgi:hypothetical protein
MCDAGPIPLYGLGDEHAARCTLYDPQRTDADALEARDA